jgi:hypothetical protein
MEFLEDRQAPGEGVSLLVLAGLDVGLVLPGAALLDGSEAMALARRGLPAIDNSGTNPGPAIAKPEPFIPYVVTANTASLPEEGVASAVPNLAPSQRSGWAWGGADEEPFPDLFADFLAPDHSGRQRHSLDQPQTGLHGGGGDPSGRGGGGGHEAGHPPYLVRGQAPLSLLR